MPAIWFDSDQFHDDVLFINYCNPFTHNHLGSITPYPNMRIVKESSFSLLLSIIYLSGINYGFMLTALYFAAAVLTYRTISACPALLNFNKLNDIIGQPYVEIIG